MRTNLLISIFLAGTLSLPAQPSRVDTPHFLHFDVEDGLSQASITAILQDHRGFIWIGTFDGLNRFDGTTFKVYRNNPTDPRSLSSNWILGLLEDSANVLWVKTEAGLDRFDRATESFHHITVSPGIRAVFPSAGAGPSLVWMKGGSIVEFDPAAGATVEDHQVERGRAAAGLPVYALANDTSGHIWIAGGTTLSRVDRSTRLIEESHEIGRHDVITILPSRLLPGDVWLGTSSGLLRFSRGKLTELAAASVTSLLEDSHGYLWIGTQTYLGRMSLRDTARFDIERFQSAHGGATSLSHNLVTQLLEDAAGSVWVGTFNGVNLYDRNAPSFFIYRHSSGDPLSLGSSFVLPIVEDKRGNLWFGTFGAGVSVLRTQPPGPVGFSHFRHDPGDPNSIRSDNARSLLCTRDGTIWIGTSGGLNVYRPSTGTLTTVLSSTRDNPSSVWVESMCEASDGSVWVTHNNQLIRFGGGRPDVRCTVRFTLPVSGEPISITEDSRGVLWVATLQTGLIRFDPRVQKFTRYAHSPGDSLGLSNDNIWTVFQDPRDTSGLLWVGTSRGLNKFDTRTGTSTRFLEQEGFPNSCVYGILQDEERRLWLSTNQGLVVFDDRQPAERKFRNYTHEDGVAGNEFNRRSYFRRRNGEMLFGGPNGVTRFHPGNLHDHPGAVPLVLTGFSRLGERVQFDTDIADVASIEIPHDQNVFSFHYAALSYGAKRIQYAYRLDGIDPDWIPAGFQRSVNYAYVPPGEYIFRVRASKNSGIWSDNQLAVRLRVHPPFWRTWWFLALAIIAFAGAVAAGVRMRVRRLQEIERLRTRIARDLHDEIGSNLSSIAMRSDLLQRQSSIGDRERQTLDDISSVALTTLNNMKDIVWLIRPGNDALDDLFLRMKDTAAAMLEGCQYTLNFPHDPPDRKVGLEWKQNVYLIYKETLANIVRHSRASTVVIDVRLIADRLSLVIRDDGIGFDPGDVTVGNGLRNIRERAALLHGRLSIEPKTGQGTSLTLETRIT